MTISFSYLTVIYQLFISYLLAIYHLSISHLSAIYQLSNSYLSAIYQLTLLSEYTLTGAPGLALFSMTSAMRLPEDDLLTADGLLRGTEIITPLPVPSHSLHYTVRLYQVYNNFHIKSFNTNIEHQFFSLQNKLWQFKPQIQKVICNKKRLKRLFQ